MTRHRTDVFIGIAFLALSGLLFWASLDIRDFASVGVGASFVPRLIAGLFLLLGLALTITGSRSTIESTYAESDDPSSDTEDPIFGGPLAVTITVLLMCGYVFIMQTLGFVIASIGYVFLQTLVLTKNAEKRYVLFLVTSILSTIAAYYLFVVVFGISLPAGLLV